MKTPQPLVPLLKIKSLNKLQKDLNETLLTFALHRRSAYSYEANIVFAQTENAPSKQS